MAVTIQQQASFISAISPIIQKYAKQNGYKFPSAIIAQACCESGYGTSYKAKHHNYFGLKYRKNRCPSANGTFEDGSKEQNPDGSYRPITDQWFEFKNMEDGVKGYFEFISISNYDAVRKATDPIQYIVLLGQCKYYTSLTYPKTIQSVINAHNLRQYDVSNNIDTSKPVSVSKPEVQKPIENNKDNKLVEGDTVKLLTDTYYSGKKIPAWVKKSTLYYRGESPNGWKFSTKKSGSITGVVKIGMLSKI